MIAPADHANLDGQGASSPRPVVSVVIATFNDRQNLMRCLDSLRGQAYPADRVQVIAVDDASTDGTAGAVRNAFPRVTVIEKRSNTGPDDSRNQGVLAASGKIVAFIDADCAAPPEWLDSLVRSMSENSAAVVGGQILHRGNLRARVIGVSDFGEFLDNRKKSVRTVPTCNMGVRHELLLRHPFESRLRMLGDVFFSHALAQDGVRPLFDPRVGVFHHPAADWRAFVRRAYRYGEGFVLTRRAAPSLAHARWVRAGGIAIATLMLGRVTLDWYRLIRFRRAAAIPLYALPAAAFLLLTKRVIGTVGALRAGRK